MELLTPIHAFYKPIFAEEFPHQQFELPIFSFQGFYEWAQEHVEVGQTIRYRTGQAQGYEDLNELAKELCEYAYFNPFNWAGYKLDGVPYVTLVINNAMRDPWDSEGTNSEYSVAEQVFDAFQADKAYDNQQYSYVNAEGAGNFRVGFNYFNLADPRASVSMWGSNSPGGPLWYHSVIREDAPIGPTGKQHVKVYMRNFPKSIFKNLDRSKKGCTFDFNTIPEITGGTASGRLDVILMFDIWYDQTERNWNYTIDVQCKELTNYEWDVLQWYNDKGVGPVIDPFTDPPYERDGEPDIPPTPPDISAITGYNIYKLDQTAIEGVLYWINTWDVDAMVVKNFNDPSSGIVSLHMLPFDAKVVTDRAVIYHNAVMKYAGGQNITANVPKQWQEFDFGTISIPTPSDYLGYAPYTSVSIYLPFIGYRELDADEVIGRSIGLFYRIDVISGAVTTWVKVNGRIRYTFSGSCAVPMPIKSADWSGVFQGMATAAASAVIATYSGGIGLAAGSALGMANGLANSKPHFNRIGSMSNTAALNSMKQAFVMVERAEPAKPTAYAQIIGNPASRSVSLGSLSGYNVLDEVHLDGINATQAELNEIENLLKSGVIF